MSGETGNSVHDPWPELRLEWAIHDAANDGKILTTFQLFAICDFDPATKDLVEDHLEQEIEKIYGVPRDRSHEVFGKAETIIWQEMEANGEA